jgi:hypothetical protein
VKPIEVNKWAQVYKPMPCCGGIIKNAAIPFIVTELSVAMMAECPACKYSYMDELSAYGFLGDPDRAVPACICKRLDDPPADSLPESTEERVGARVV